MSQYARDLRHILATLNDQGADSDETPLPEEEDVDTIHVYPVEGGGILFTRTPLEDEEAAAPIVDSQPPSSSRASMATTPPPFVLFLFLLCLFLVGDMADTQLIAIMTPTATIAITPEVHTVGLQSTATLGKLLSPITLTESQTVVATGHGHQDARQATGTLTFYNGLATVQQVAAGTLFTGADDTSVVTDASVLIPAANPPNFGVGDVPAHAVHTGTAGNIPAEDINATLSSGLYVKNLMAFSGGQGARDFPLVTPSDRDSAEAFLRTKVTASMTAALQGQLLPGQALRTLPCSPAVSADHAPGEEVASLTVTVSDTCTAVAYDVQHLQVTATQLLTAQATKTFGTGYILSGDVHVSVTKATTTPGVTLAFSSSGTFAFTFNGQAQQSLKTLLAGKPRETALRLLLRQPGIHRASISGISDNQPLPDDLGHIHLLIVLLLF